MKYQGVVYQPNTHRFKKGLGEQMINQSPEQLSRHGQWAINHGLPSTDNGQWTMDNGLT